MKIALLVGGLVFVSLLAAASASAALTVTIVKAGPGAASGTVKSEPAGIDCGASCGPTAFFSSFKLQATPGAGYYFSEWSGTEINCANGPQSNPCELAISVTDRTATATFSPLPDPPSASTGGTAPGGAWYLTRLEGTVNPNEFAVGECRFEYDTRPYVEGEGPHGISTPCLSPAAGELDPNAGSPEAVHAETEPLEPNTTYHYRLVASNLGGTSRGIDHAITTGPAPADSCSNAARRAEQGVAALTLPDCMALEMVSPSAKEGQMTFSPSVSANGERVRFVTGATLAEAQGSLGKEGDFYVASRGSNGWALAPTQPPSPLTYGWEYVQAQSFSPDFSRWFQGAASVQQAQSGVYRIFEGGLGGLFSPVSPLLSPASPAVGGATGVNTGQDKAILGTQLQGASGDHSHVFFAPLFNNRTGLQPPYLPGDPLLSKTPSEVPGSSQFIDPNVYVVHPSAAGEPSLELLARDGHGRIWGGNCGVRFGGTQNTLEASSEFAARNQGAVSSDGSRVYFSTRPSQPATGACNTANKLRILERLEGGTGVWIGQLFGSECDRVAPACSATDGDDFYRGASDDGSKVYFTTNRQLANSDLDTGSLCSGLIGLTGCDLYMYDSNRSAGHRLVQVSAGEADASHPTVGAGAKVLGVAAISTDGSHVYFVAAGVLTTKTNPAGAIAINGQPNLYLWNTNTESVNFIGTLQSGDSRGLWNNSGSFRNWTYPVPAEGRNGDGKEVGGNGHVLLFQSRAELTANDTDGSHLDVYRYDADTDELDCLSCRPGGPDGEPFDVTEAINISSVAAGLPLGTDSLETGRWASEDGKTVSFRTPESLVAGDDDELPSSYVWREGQLFRLPGSSHKDIQENGGTGSAATEGPALSPGGNEIAFRSFSPLVPQDGDSQPDIYVARAAGGFANPNTSTTPCLGEACQGAAPAAPDSGEPASAAFSGSGNTSARGRSCPKGKRRVATGKAGRTRCMAKKAHKRRHHKRHHHKRHVIRKQGGRK